MNVNEVAKEMGLEIVTGTDLQKEITGVYIGDLLSNVMAKARAGNLWITIQGHQNVVAVALLADVAAIIIAEDFTVEEKAITRAGQKGINILRSQQTAYEIAGDLYEMDIG